MGKQVKLSFIHIDNLAEHNIQTKEILQLTRFLIRVYNLNSKNLEQSSQLFNMYTTFVYTVGHYKCKLLKLSCSFMEYVYEECVGMM